MRIIHCYKLNKDAPGFDAAPLPGELGKKIYEHISKEAWQLWLNHQTMLINEHRLSMIDPRARAFLMQEAEKFLFGSGSDKPAQYVPQKH
ncbi:MAG: oxidative damage protection protein [Gammaproteobacteria bacterium RIFCSPHIGHO2_12_FULL_38_14]|nr:MAG: oxidative damage protection protein [Gammaproteobacteria bacterium RIFCSPHIGHO2_12_FULL_38_14]